MHLGLQTVKESRFPGGAVVHQLVFKGKSQSHLGRLPSHSHQSARGSILPMLLDLQTAMEFQFLREVVVQKLVLKGTHR